MNGRRAKELRRKVCSDPSLMVERKYIRNDGRTIFNNPRTPRAVYQYVKSILKKEKHENNKTR